jgi:hypothetical protein
MGILRVIKLRSTFLRSKATGLMSQTYGTVYKRTLKVCKEILSRKNSVFSFAVFLLLRYQMTAGRVARELWWTNQEISSVDVIPSWISILMYNLGDKQ